MAVTTRNKLPDNHPFARGLIAFGVKPPKSSSASLPSEKPDPMQPGIDALEAQMGEFFSNKGRKGGASDQSSPTPSASLEPATPRPPASEA